MAAPMEDKEVSNRSFAFSEDAEFEEGHGICRLCLKARAAYTCPRCNLGYCSLSCYRSERHADCSESFYKNNFIQALKETRGSSEDKKKVLEMLGRLDAEEPTQDSDDDEDEDAGTESLEKRLAGLDLDAEPERVWERLTPQERHEFDEVLRAGALGSMLQEWTPWWTKHDRELIRELGGDQKPATERREVAGDPPAVLDSIPRLSELTKTSPSPLIVFNLINVLYCYAFVGKLYNGGHMDIPLHAVQSFLEVCTVFSANASFSCVEDAIQSAVQTITQLKSCPSERTHLISIIQDVVHITLGRSKSSPCSYVEAALSDLHELFKKTRAIYKRLPKTEQSTAEKSRSAVFQAKKKVIFYLAWVRENPGALGEKAAELKLLHVSMGTDQQTHDRVKTDVEANLKTVRAKPSKSLIEELD